MIFLKLGVVLTLTTISSALYSSSDDVIELTAANFKSEVLDSEGLWYVEFYAPWCGHCKNLAPEWKKAASALKGTVNIGAVDMDQHQSVGGPYGIKGFPTIKIFGYDKTKPKDYNGARNANGIIEDAHQAVMKMAQERLSGGSKKSSGSGGGKKESGKNAVVTLTDENFQELVLDSDESWLVEFYAPWCGHCKRLEPEWKSAANSLASEDAGKSVKMGALDATANQFIANKYGIQGYPTIKIFKKGEKDDPKPFEGGRDASSILAAALELYEEDIEAPEILEITSSEVLENICIGKQLCAIVFLSDILDTGADGRNQVLELVGKMGDRYKKKKWGWGWTEAYKQNDLEKALGIGGAGYPAMAVIVEKKKMFTILTRPFNEEGIQSFLDELSFGRAGRNSYSLPDSKLPNITACDPWDGKDGQLPEEEEIDLSDFKWDDEL